MKTHILITVILIFALSSCSDSGTDMPSTTTDPITLEHKIEFELTGSGFNHQLFRADSLGYRGLQIQYTRTLSSAEYKVIFADDDWNGSTGDDAASLTLTFPKLETGLTNWNDQWADSTKPGCKI